MKTTVQYLNNTKDNNPKGPVELTKVLESIKNPKKNILEKIEKARNHGKGSQTYSFIKEQELPCFLFNFNFQGGVKNENAAESTNMIYLDIDNVEDSVDDIKDKLKEIPYCYSVWKSLSNKGLGILFRVSGVTQDNFIVYKEHIINNYDLPFDKGCINVNRKNVISYDPELFINEDSSFLFLERKVQSSTINQEKVQCSSILSTIVPVKMKSSKGIVLDCTLDPEKKSVRFNNKQDFVKDDVTVYQDGIEVVEVTTFHKIESGGRNKALYEEGKKLLFLNQKITLETFTMHLQNINKYKCVPALEYGEVVSIAKKIFNNKKEIKVKTKKKKIIFDKRAQITGKEKQKIAGKCMGELKRNSRINMLQEIVDKFEGELTQKKLVELSGLSIRTIKTYWKQLKFK